jgi:hypothetical protein
MNFKKVLTLVIGIILFNSQNAFSQCCGGGGGSPIAGGASQGVLLEKQIELNINYQNINTHKFLNGDVPSDNYLARYTSQYIYSRIAYGVTKNFTMSIESGYYINKTQYGLHYADTIASKGFGDLLLFPKYDILNRSDGKKTTEITLGLGFKIPVGPYNDSMLLFHNPSTGADIYDKKPPAVQPTTGSQDIVFYGFLLRGYPLKNFKVFGNILYIRKGWNPEGEKFGNYLTVGLFACKKIIPNLMGTLQLKYENIDRMQRNKNMPMPNYDPYATGSRKIALVPQISYSMLHGKLTCYVMSEIVLYQYVNNVQVASQYLTSVGLSYRFFTYDVIKPKNESEEKAK